MWSNPSLSDLRKKPRKPLNSKYGYNKGGAELIKNILQLAASIFVLSGCVSTQAVVDRLGNKYVGGNFDEFVIHHGTPRQKFTLSSGDIVYTWNSGTSSVAMPATATTTGYGNTATTTINGGGSIDLFCEAQFITSPDGVVKRVSILKDTIGFWTTSMCHEIFDK